MDIVLKLRELRRIRGLSQREVAKKTGIHEKTISSFETGARIQTIKLSQLQKLLKVYDVTEEKFFSKSFEQNLETVPASDPLFCVKDIEHGGKARKLELI